MACAGVSSLSILLVACIAASVALALVGLGTAIGREPEGWLITSEGWRGVTDERRYLRALKRFPDAAVFVAEAGRYARRPVGLGIARDERVEITSGVEAGARIVVTGAASLLSASRLPAGED